MTQQLDLFGPPPETAKPLAIPPAAPSDAALRIAERLPAEVRIGTSSWSFPGWAGIVYEREASESRLARHGLAAYARHPLLRAVGIDRTYYAPIEAEAFAAYADAVPDTFRFLVKAPERCTVARFPMHERYGDERGAANPAFLDPGWATDAICAPAAAGLGAKLGVIVFQVPPQPTGVLGGAERFAERLYAFLAELPRGLPYAVELRNAELLTMTYADALGSARVSHCINVHPNMPAPDVQAELCDGPNAPALVARWMLGHGQRYEQARERYRPFNRLVDEDPSSRLSIARLCRRAVARGRSALVTINNKAEGSAPLSAFRLAGAIAELESSSE